MKTVFRIIFLFFSLWILCGGASRCVCEIKAYHDYANSRPGGLNSSEFVAMGIEKGMTINQVDALLSKADSKTGLLKMECEGRTEEEFSKFYEFTYGPQWTPFWVGRPRHICNELIKVSFDEAGLAVRVTRISISGLLIFAESKQVDLTHNLENAESVPNENAESVPNKPYSLNFGG